MRKQSFLLPLVPLVFGGIVFEVLARYQVVPAFLFPPPSAVWGAFIESYDALMKATYETVLSSSLGLGCSILVGVSIGILLATFLTLRKMFYPYAVFFQTVPIIAVAPLLVVWLGFGIPTVVASSFIVSVFPVIANSLQGLTSTDSDLVNLFKILKSSKSDELLQLRLPFALPQILTGIKIAAGLAVIGAIVGEFISGTGLGGLIDGAKNQQKVELIFAAILVASLLGIFYFLMISQITQILLKRWHASSNQEA